MNAHALRAVIARGVALVVVAQRGLVGLAARRLGLEVEPHARDEAAAHDRVALVHAQRERFVEQLRVVARVGCAREAQVLDQAPEHHGIVAVVAARERFAVEQLVVGRLRARRADLLGSRRGARPPQPVGREQRRSQQRELEQRTPHRPQHTQPERRPT